MRRNHSKSWGFESLEARHMMAGDVTVSVVAGVLHINGDSDANSISISATANPNEFTISAGDVDTTINGGAAPVTLAGAIAGADISLGAGSDSLEFDTTTRAINFGGELKINLGTSFASGNTVSVVGSNGIAIAGNLELVSLGDYDSVVFRNVQVAGSLDFDFPTTGTNRIGQIRFQDGSVAGDVRINTHGEYHDVTLRADIQGNVNLEAEGGGTFFRIESSIGGNLTASLYDSHLDLGNCEIGGDMMVTGVSWITVQQSRIDRHVLLTLFEGQMGSVVSFVGGDWQTQFNHVGGNFVVTMDANEPSVVLYYLNVENDLVVRGGDGVDNARLNNVRAGNSLLIDTGAGNDIVWVHNSSAYGEAAILAGAGSDYVLVGNLLAARSFYVDAAAGFDLANISYTWVSQTMFVSMGADSDQATVYASSARNLSIDAGSGYDAVRIEASAADNLYAALGDGSDSLAVVSSLARVSALFDGGAGYDFLSLRGNLLAGLARRNFEALGA